MFSHENKSKAKIFKSFEEWKTKYLPKGKDQVSAERTDTDPTKLATRAAARIVKKVAHSS